MRYQTSVGVIEANSADEVKQKYEQKAQQQLDEIHQFGTQHGVDMGDRIKLKELNK